MVAHRWWRIRHGAGMIYWETSPDGQTWTIGATPPWTSVDTGGFFLTPIGQNVGRWAEELMNILILTSSFACGMAFHNTAARYAYSLGREGVFLRFLGKTHPRFKSPYTASVAQSVTSDDPLGL